MCSYLLAQVSSVKWKRLNLIFHVETFFTYLLRDLDEGYDMNEVDESMDRHQKEIRQAKLKSQEFNNRLRDLTIAIRFVPAS